MIPFDCFKISSNNGWIKICLELIVIYFLCFMHFNRWCVWIVWCTSGFHRSAMRPNCNFRDVHCTCTLTSYGIRVRKPPLFDQVTRRTDRYAQAVRSDLTRLNWKGSVFRRAPTLKLVFKCHLAKKRCFLTCMPQLWCFCAVHSSKRYN
jgi:hypothetical protein